LRPDLAAKGVAALLSAAALMCAPPACSQAAPAVIPGAPALPEGPLLSVARGDTSATFLVVDGAAKAGDTADFRILEVFYPPIVIADGKLVVESLSHQRVDCTQRTDTRLSSVGYNAAGGAIVGLGAAASQPLAAATPDAMIAGALCQGVALPAEGRVIGHDAALKQARTMLSAPTEIVAPDAQPK